MIRKYYTISLMLTLPLWGQSLRIAQVDNSALLSRQEIRLYVNVMDSQGNLILDATADQFTLQESTDNESFRPVRGELKLVSQSNYFDGIKLLLLIDNSGSMYRTIDGEDTDDVEVMRITWVRRAVIEFLGSITNPNDEVGLISYNSFFTSHTKPTTDKAKIAALLAGIKKPIGEARFTELYSSLYLAIDEFRNYRGRKVIILLSDGENGAYFPNTGKVHPQLGEKVYTHEEPILYAQQEGISVFTINFGRRGERGDRNLTRLAAATGGERLDAHDQSELSAVYKLIMEQVLNEYSLTYKANMDPADQRYVRLSYTNETGTAQVTRFYFAGTILGQPLAVIPIWLVVPLLVGAIGLWLLSRAKFDRRRAQASLEVLRTRVGSVSTQVVALQGNKTVIGRADDADMTIIGDPQVKENHATIIFDAKRNTHTIVTDVTVIVNNKPTTKKILEPGDVINIGGTLTVFDEGLGES